MKVLGALVSLLLVAGSLRAKDNSLSPQEEQEGWILLFDGQSLFGWTQAGGAQWRVANGELVAKSGESGYLRSNSAFADFALRCDFRISAGGESGIFLRIAKQRQPQDSGYKLQINNNDLSFSTGSLVKQLKAAHVRAAPNQWHSYAVRAEGDHFEVELDGQRVLNGDAAKSKVGFLGLQFVKGTPVEFRNIKLKPLGLGRIFNGQNLYGWKPANPPPPPKKKGFLKKLIPGGEKLPEWSVKDGAIFINKGPSELETNSAYDDFVLQLSVRADARNRNEHPSGGVYVRADKAAEGTGYKAEIHNQYQPHNPGQPVGAVTGGLASIQSAKRALGADNELLTLTIAARGHHLATWVNGYQTADFEDARPDGPDALIQARTVPGPIRLAADNAASSLDFENIRIASLPKAGPAPMAAKPGGGAPPPTQAPAPGAAPFTPSAPTAPLAPAGNPHEKEISRLEQQALASDDPARQVKIYDQILALDPNNLVAFNGRKDAQDKLDQLKAQQAREEQEKAAQEAAEKQKEEQAQSNEANKDTLVQKAEAALIARNLSEAASQIALARKIAPGDPKVLDLDLRIESLQRAKRRKRWAWIGAGVIGLASLVTLAVLSLGKKQAYLEIIDGMEEGKRYILDQQVVHIGAVAQDGGRKNEIVVADLDHMVSRFHCEIHRQNSNFWVADCNSANGTFLNGHRVRPGKPVPLKKGARLQLAEACTLRLRFQKQKKDK